MLTRGRADTLGWRSLSLRDGFPRPPEEKRACEGGLWGVPAGLDRTLLPGDHYSLLCRPKVERLARELTARFVRNGDG
jgi:thioesterase domain-containing protein